MGKGRLEAFSDGVIAIILTIMVLELKTPHSADWEALRPLAPVLLSYFISFVYLGIYWNNHHHLLHAVQKVNGAALWANLHLLFWLSLTPFVTGWMGETHFTSLPVALYGCVLFCCGAAYYLLTRVLIRHHDGNECLAAAVGNDTKGKISMAVYAAGVAVAFYAPWVSLGLYAAVAVMWLVPDRRIEGHCAPKG